MASQKVVRISHKDLINVAENEEKQNAPATHNNGSSKNERHNDRGSKKSRRPALQIYQPGMMRQQKPVKQSEDGCKANSKESSPAPDADIKELSEKVQTHKISDVNSPIPDISSKSPDLKLKQNLSPDGKDKIGRVRVSPKCVQQSSSALANDDNSKKNVESSSSRKKKRPDMQVYVPRVKTQHEKSEVPDDNLTDKNKPAENKPIVYEDDLSNMTITFVNSKLSPSSCSLRKVDLSSSGKDHQKEFSGTNKEDGAALEARSSRRITNTEETPSPDTRSSRKYSSTRHSSSASFSDQTSEQEDNLASSKEWDSEVEREVLRMKRSMPPQADEVDDGLTRSQTQREIRQLKEDLTKKPSKRRGHQRHGRGDGVENGSGAEEVARRGVEQEVKDRSGVGESVRRTEGVVSKVGVESGDVGEQGVRREPEPDKKGRQGQRSEGDGNNRVAKNCERAPAAGGETPGDAQTGSTTQRSKKRGKVRERRREVKRDSEQLVNSEGESTSPWQGTQPKFREEDSLKRRDGQSGRNLPGPTTSAESVVANQRGRNNSGSSLQDRNSHKDVTRNTNSPLSARDESKTVRGGGILRLPANSVAASGVPDHQLLPQATDFPSLPQRPTPSRGRGFSRGRGRGSRTLYDPNNPNAQQSQASTTNTLEFHDPYDMQDSPDYTTGSVYPEDYYSAPYFNYPPAPYYNYPVDYYGMPYQVPPAADFYMGSVRQENQAAVEQVLGELEPLRNQLMNILSRRLKTGREQFERINRLRKEVGHRYKQLVLLSPELTNANGGSMEQSMWRIVFYQLIESLRKHVAEENDGGFKEELLSVLEEAVVFYEDLLNRLEDTFQFKLEDYLDQDRQPPENSGRLVKLAVLSAHRSMIALGDIARYKEQAMDTTNYGKARSWYLKAQHLAPKNGRPYNQLAILALYTRRKLDAVYFYMRSLLSSNAFETAKESLVSLFEEVHKKSCQARKKAEDDKQAKIKEKQHRRPFSNQERRIEIWVSPDGSKEADEVDDDKEPDLMKLSVSELNRRFVLSFLQVHGKLFTKIGMETFPEVCSTMLREFQALLQQSPEPISSVRLLQLLSINMFSISNTELKDAPVDNCRSLLQENALQVAFDMIGLVAHRCSQLLESHSKSSLYPSMLLDDELHLLLPSVKLWSDWMTCHHDLWNPVPSSIDPQLGPHVDTWQWIADLLNTLGDVEISHVSLHDQMIEGCTPVILAEDSTMAGYVPLLNLSRRLTYVHTTVDKEVAKDCLRISRLRTFGDYLCGIEPPVLSYDVHSRRYMSLVTSSDEQTKSPPVDDLGHKSDTEESQDVIVESETEDDVEHVRELRAKRAELQKQIDERQQQQNTRQAVFDNENSVIELEIRPLFLVPDTNCFIDHLKLIMALVTCQSFIVVVPLVVINELDGLTKGCRSGGNDTEQHAKQVQRCAKEAVDYLEDQFEQRNSRVKALTSKGTVMDTIAYRSEESDHIGNNDDLILSCCLHYCKDKARDFMPKDPGNPIRLVREVVLLTDDRNLRLKAHTRNVPVKDLESFCTWSKVG